MSQPITVDILSDSDDEPPNNAVVTTPFSPQSKWQITEHLANPECLDARPPDDAVSTTPFSPQPKRQRIRPYSNPTKILVIDDDDPSPYKAIVSASTPSILAETPMLDFSNHDVAVVKSTSKGLSDVSSPDVAIVKYNSKGLSDPQKLSDLTLTPSIVAETPMSEFSNPNVGIVNCTSKGLSDPQKFSGICGLICLESDNESEIGSQNEKWQQNDTLGSAFDVVTDSELRSRLVGSEFSTEESLSAHENLTPMSADSSLPTSSKDGSTQREKLRKAAAELERVRMKEEEKQLKEREKLQKAAAELERVRMREEENQLKEREKLQKAAMKAQIAELERVRLKEEKTQLKEREKLQKAAAEVERVRLKEEENQLIEREKLRKAAAEVERVRMKEEENKLKEREKLQKAAAEVERVRLKEEENLLREREKLQKATMKAEAAELERLRLKEQQNQREKLLKAAVELEGVRLKEEENQLREANDDTAEEIDRLDPTDNILKRKSRCKGNANKENDVDEGATKRNKIDEERVLSKEAKNELREREKLQKVDANFKRLQLKEEKKLLREREKLQKAAMKAEALELKKLEKEKQKWEKGKFALKSIVAKVDSKVVELGSVGGHLLTRFAEKGLTYRITSNPIERSIVWNMAVPDQISKFSSNSDDIPYVLLVVEAEEFCNLVINETLMEHVSHVRSRYPSHTICYVTNRLMAYINKREQEQYKNPDNCSGWKRPPVEEVLSKLATHFVKVHSRQCIDEAELAEHVVGLTCSLASCRFRKKLTRLSVNANGSLIPKDCIDKDLFKKNSWLKALIAIPKVQPRFALAIWKKYPTMKSLLSVYMDPNKSVHEKEFLLKDLTIEGLLGDDRRLGEVCSKRVFRILTAQCGSSNTDDVEDGADFFSRNKTT